MTLLQAITKITEIPITMEGSNWTVMAKAEQIPNTCTVIGLLSFSGSINNFRFLLERKCSFSSFSETKRTISSFFSFSFSTGCVPVFIEFSCAMIIVCQWFGLYGIHFNLCQHFFIFLKLSSDLK